MVASSALISCAKFEIATMNICQDIANFVFGQNWWVKGGGSLRVPTQKLWEEIT